MRWFKHDTDAVSDPKVQRLLAAHGPAALGAYWALVEAMGRDEKPIRPEDVPTIAYQLHCKDEDFVQMVSEMVEQGLLVDTADGLVSVRMAVQIEKLHEKSRKGSIYIKKRWHPEELTDEEKREIGEL